MQHSHFRRHHEDEAHKDFVLAHMDLGTVGLAELLLAEVESLGPHMIVVAVEERNPAVA